jgi:ABC-type sugar transport system ATPase subunit
MLGISIQHIRRAFDRNEVLKGASLDIEDGELVSLVGPSRCGKSTLLRIIADPEAQTSGRIMIGGDVIDNIRLGERNRAIVFQPYAHRPHLKVFDSIVMRTRP